MIKVYKKILLIGIIIITVLLLFNTNVYAEEYKVKNTLTINKTNKWEEVKNRINNFLRQYNHQDTNYQMQGNTLNKEEQWGNYKAEIDIKKQNNTYTGTVKLYKKYKEKKNNSEIKIEANNDKELNDKIRQELMDKGCRRIEDFNNGDNIHWTISEKLQYTANITIGFDQNKGKYTGTIKITEWKYEEVPDENKKDKEKDKDKEINTSVDPIKNPGFYEPTDKTGENTDAIEIGKTIITILRILGTIIGVIALMLIGIRYMFGSLEERANFKELMIPYLIGAIMVFTIPNIVGIIYDLVKSL